MPQIVVVRNLAYTCCTYSESLAGGQSICRQIKCPRNVRNHSRHCSYTISTDFTTLYTELLDETFFLEAQGS